ncbi:MAG: phenylalanine--tRNA ligase subunit beta [Clostridia bacterium]|nr:phenylalanine--tRNA ligase subunit beta [Clostridia bacterium]
MKAPLSWLKDYVDIDVPVSVVTEKLFGCGFEVEEVIDLGKDISGIVVGEVTECEPVEGTHLHVCKVDCGSHGTFQICCGADNVAVGIKAPTALVGATVYATSKDHTTIEGVQTIKRGKLRGYESCGMLCSGTELGLNEDLYPGAGYNGLLLLPADAPVGGDVKPIVGLDDIIFDISITANRPDCQSIFGIAREIAAALNKPLRYPDISYTAHSGNWQKIKITDEAPELCNRYIGHYVANVKIGQSPAWIRRRLALCGIRSISNIVDITNFVLLELGQPMHSFDLSTLEGREIVIRRAKDGEKIVTLDGNEFTLCHDNLVICDGEKPCALAGIMGGLNSEIKSTTNEVLFETAKFARDNIRKTSRSLGQHSDSSALYEKGVYEYTTEMASKRSLHLVEQLGCGIVTDMRVDVTTPYSKLDPKTMTASISNINALLGIDVPAEAMEDILTRLCFKVERDGDILKLTVPRYREDIDLEPDIAEEVIRLYGYDHITGTFLPTATITNGGFTDEQRAKNRMKTILVGHGLYEVTTYSFYSPKDLDMLHYPADAPERQAIRIINPISEDLSIMRRTMAPSMVNVAVRNLRRGNLNGRVFELARVYIPKELPIKDYPEERDHLALCQWGHFGFFELKGICEDIADALNVKFSYVPAEKPFTHPGKTADIYCGDTPVGFIGMVSPTIMDELTIDREIGLAELDYSLLKDMAKPFIYKPLPKFPVVTRDLALICARSVTCAQVEDVIRSACKYVTDVKMFDLYEGIQVGPGKKSMAFNITFTPTDKALDDDADKMVKRILSSLKQKLDIDLRY